MFNLLKDIDSYQFWEGAKQNKLFIQKSTKSKKYFFYSRSFSGVEANEPYEWEEASGKGTIYSFTISNIAGGSEFYINKTPYIIFGISYLTSPEVLKTCKKYSDKSLRLSSYS